MAAPSTSASRQIVRSRKREGPPQLAFVPDIPSGLTTLLGANVAVPTSTALSMAIALITGAMQAAHTYAKVRTQGTVSAMDVGIRLPPPRLTNASGDAPVATP